MPDPDTSPMRAFRKSRGYRASALVKRLHVGLTVLMEERLREDGIQLSRPQALVLMHLLEHPGASNAELARMSGVSPQTMHQILLRLGRDGLVDRAPHPWLRRVMCFHATDEGRRLVMRGGEVARDAIKRTLGGLSAAEQDQLVALLERCVARLPSNLPKRE